MKISALILALAASARSALACSYAEIPVPDAGSVNGTKYVIARTMELGDDLPWPVVFTEYEIRVRVRGEDGARFGVLTLQRNALVPFTHEAWYQEIAEGMNEVGFTVSTHTLRTSEYEALESSQPNDIDRFNLTIDLLRACADVDEAIAFVSAHRVTGANDGAGSHWAIADASGRSIVVEYVKGKRSILENTPRVMTNDPHLSWHWRNLNTYVNLRQDYPHQNDFLQVETSVGPTPQALGHGWNLHGLPGDSASPSRFIQMFYLRGYSMHAAPPKTVDDAIVLASGLLNKVFIPKGTIGNESVLDNLEYTPYGIVKIPAERLMLVRSYRDLQWRQVNLSRVDFTQEKRWPIEDGTLGIEDITERGSKGGCSNII